MAHVQRKLNTELWTSLTANWSLWLPASFVGFKLVPPHLRIPYVSAVSMVWTTILSVLQGRFRAAEAEQHQQTKAKASSTTPPKTASTASMCNAEISCVEHFQISSTMETFWT